MLNLTLEVLGEIADRYCSSAKLLLSALTRLQENTDENYTGN